MGTPRSLGAHALAVACAVTCAGCSTAPVFGEAGGGSGAATTSGATTTSSAGAGPSTSAQGGDGGGGGDGGRGGAGDGGAGLGGAGGQGGDGGGCVSDCGERRCGVDACGRSCGPASDTWARNLPESVSRLVLRPGTSDLYVVGDGDRIERVDVCLGGRLAGQDVSAGGSLRGVGLVGTTLGVGVNAGAAMDVAIFLEADALGAAGLAVNLPATSPADRIWGGTAHDGALWLGLDDDGSALVRVRPGGEGENPAAERFLVGDVGAAPGGRGLASSPFGLIHQQGDATLALVDPGSCEQGVCEAALSPPLEAKGFQVTYAGGQAFVPSFESGHGRLMRVAVPAMALGPAVQRDVDGLDDGFTDVAVHDGVVYVVGFTGGLVGSPWLLTYPPDFQTLTPPLAERVIAGAADLGWAIAVDASGVYVAGSHENGGGFVIKCTHDLECPSVSSAVDR